MTDSMHSTILRRMTGGQAADEAADTPQTSSRALRLALTKAANDTVGLVLTVTSTAEDVQPLDEMLGNLDPQLMLVGLYRADALVGLMAVDMQLRAAIMEMQTVGQLLSAAADDRAPTGTDKMMCDPVLKEFLTALPEAMISTPLQGWVDGTMLGERIGSARAAGLILQDDSYRSLRLNVDLSVADRQGQVLIVLPLLPAPSVAPTTVDEKPNWDMLFPAAVEAAPAELEALLHRFDMPIAQARSLQVGQVIPLAGCSVNSVRLLASDGKQVGTAKLGQLGGKRAVRIEAPPRPQMGELPNAAISQGLPAVDDALSLDVAPAPVALEPDEPLMSPAEAPDLPLPDVGAVDIGVDENVGFDSGAAVVPMDIETLND